ncbi:response regulator [Paraburkholderia sp. BCC1876]|uniref:response regulator transcription factor n=1 Tax=Paraburkholderia sp. BCC1876 TaxID=2676303 RepID=UPI001591A8C4|nr:response regulator [Paraburkholderia sp. BCC1876]
MSRDQGKCLLIADDDPEMLAAYSVFFRDQGFDIRTAANGADAFAEYCVWRPDAVLLDIEMPLLDGRGVARAIRLARAIPAPLLLATSGLTSLSENDESIRAGFDDHFTKPVLLPVILAAIICGLASSKTQTFSRVANKPAEES